MAILKDTRINGVLIADRYHNGSEVQPALYMDKRGEYVAGIGPNGNDMTIQFGCADKLGGNWSLSNTMIWKYNGQLDISDSNIILGGYKFNFPSKTGTVALLDDIPSIPSIPDPTTYYWANIHISSIMNSSTSPTFDAVYATSFYASSDKRLKTNIKLANFDYYNILKKINLYTFDWKDANKNIDLNTKNFGTIAQELRDIMPDKLKKFIVYGEESNDDYLKINDNKLVYMVIGALQQQLDINKKLENEILLLKKDIQQLKGE